MKISEEGKNLIKQFEGFMRNAYKAIASEKYYTIGYGHYGPDVLPGMTVDKAGADRMLTADLIKFEKAVMKYDHIYHYTQNEFDALVSFAYNIGSIDQLTAYGTRNKATIAGKIPLYNKAGGKELAGLTKRRAAEQKLFMGSKAEKKTEITPDKYPVLRKGSNGKYVKILQELLNEKGGFNLTVDGKFGPNTYNAVIGFQGLSNLMKDGVVGPKTWKELLS